MPPRREGSALKTSESNKIEKKRISTKKKWGKNGKSKRSAAAAAVEGHNFPLYLRWMKPSHVRELESLFAVCLSLNAVLSAERRHALKPPFLFLWATWPRHRPVPTRVQFNWQLKTLLKAGNSLQRLPRNAAAKKMEKVPYSFSTHLAYGIV